MKYVLIHNLYIQNKYLRTPTQDGKVASFIPFITEHSDQHHVQHYSFTQHPTEHRYKKILQQCCYNLASNLNSYVCVNVICKSYHYGNTSLLVAFSIPAMNTTRPKASAMHKFRLINR